MPRLAMITQFIGALFVIFAVVACGDDEVVQQERDAKIAQEAVVAVESKMAEVAEEQEEAIDQFKDVISQKIGEVRSESEATISALQNRINELEQKKAEDEKTIENLTAKIEELKLQQANMKKQITQELVDAIEDTM